MRHAKCFVTAALVFTCLYFIINSYPTSKVYLSTSLREGSPLCNSNKSIHNSTPKETTLPPEIQSTLSNESNGSLRDDRKLLAVLATSWVPEKEKEKVHENVAKFWGSWPGTVQPVIYTNLSTNEKSFTQCIKSGWKFASILETKCEGIPIMKNMVVDIMKNFPNSDFYGYINSDILFDPGLVETLNFVKNHTKDRPVMLIGERTNVDFTKPHVANSPKDVLEIAKKGRSAWKYAIDYFITDRSFPWDKVPDFVIGRQLYDNYVHYFGLQHKALVIDVTQTIKAVHQSTKDGNNAGNLRHHKNCNRKMITAIMPKFTEHMGYITCALNYTHRDKSGNITMSSRKKPAKDCKGSYP